MSALIAEFGMSIILICFVIMLFAGTVKGTIGFALPMIAVSGIGSLLSAELAIAAIILPGFVTNVVQTLREGVAAAVATLRIFWRLNLILIIVIALAAQLVVALPDWSLFIILGAMVTTVGVVQLSGWQLKFPPAARNRVEWLVGGIAGIFGGLAGVWGPPITIYLLALKTEKRAMVRAQGLAFMLGSVALIGAHLKSGVLNAQSVQLSAAMVVPAMIGLMIGRVLQDRMDQERFRRATLYVLVLAGLNLLRRGFLG